MEITNLAIFSTLLGNRSTFWCVVSEFPTKPLVLFSSNAVWDKNPTPTNRFRYQELIPAYCPEWPGSWVASWEKFHVDRLMVRFMGYPNRERFGATPRFRWNTSWVRSFYMLGRSFLAVLKCFLCTSKRNLRLIWYLRSWEPHISHQKAVGKMSFPLVGYVSSLAGIYLVSI